MKIPLLFLTLIFTLRTFAQTDPEFSRGAILYLSAHQGVNTAFNASPDHYIGGMDLTTQFAIIPGHLRLGAGGGFVFTNKNISGLAGPRLAWKLKTFQLKPAGSVLNLQLQAEHLWGTDDEKLVGGLLGIELFKTLSFMVMAHREFHWDRWWFRAGLGWNLLHKKRTSPTGTDPMRDQ